MMLVEESKARLAESKPFEVFALFNILLLLVFALSLKELVLFWLDSDEYGHGLLLSGIAVYTVLQRKAAINSFSFETKKIGAAIIGVALFVNLAGVLADINVVQYYAFVVSVLGVSYFIGGAPLFRLMLFPASLLFFSIPLPYLINTLLTQKLQFFSTDIGVFFIRLMGMPVLQEGNIINMGNFVMLVEEACSGLRYLLPLMGIGWIAAYSYRGTYLQRLTIFLLTIPITVIMNSLRIAVTGLIIKYAGEEAASGFLHDFEGWVVFCVACFILYICIEIITFIQSKRFGSYRFFTLHYVDSKSEQVSGRMPIRPYFLLVIFILVFGSATQAFTLSEPTVPERTPFSDFPLRVGQWEYFPNVLDEKVLAVLKADDYFLGDFLAGQSSVSLYMAYYGSQRDGSVIHSPKDCLPAGGWSVVSNEVIALDSLGFSGKGNRTVIENAGERLLVYYWVNQQSDNYASELMARLKLLWRAILYDRTDGTLVRVITKIDQDEEKADRQIKLFLQELSPLLSEYLPE